jgi:hypothetical protein
MEKRSCFRKVLLAAVLFIPGSAALAQDIAIDRLPRPAAQTPAANKIAAALAAKDSEFRQQAADCKAQAQRGNAEYRVGARRLLETTMLYSVEAAVSSDCGGAHPDSSATALTFDLQTGISYDLDRVFHVGSGHLAPAAVPIVSKYLQRMVGGDCGDMADTLQQADLSLGVTRTDLIFYLAVPHAIVACFPPVQVPFAALVSVADQAELQRLGPPFTAQNAAVCPGVMVVGSNNEVGLATVVKGSPRVGFVSPSTEKLRECPSARPECRLQSFLVPGDIVVAGDRVGGFRCVTFRSATGRQTSGFLPSAALVDQPAPSPAVADWTGRWIRDEEASITIAVEGAALAVKGDATWGGLDPQRVKRRRQHRRD